MNVESTQSSINFLERASEVPYREVRYEHSLNLGPILDRFGVSLLVSTYQAGKLVVIGLDGGQVVFSFHNFERAMGLAIGDGRIAVGATGQIWFLRNAAKIAAHIEPEGHHDACFLTRSSHVTGEIQVHEMAWRTASSGWSTPRSPVYAPSTRNTASCRGGCLRSFRRWRPKIDVI